MKVILSPAKSINENVDCSHIAASQHLFQDESAHLVSKLAKLSVGQIMKLMSVSQDIADLNFKRFQAWSLPFNTGNSKPAGIIFTGAAYQKLDYSTLSKKEMEIGQEKLRILSGLYGLLRPLDLIQPYRLEMGTAFKVSPKVTNIYKYWADKLRDRLQEELHVSGAKVLVNAASNEYSKALQLDKFDTKIVTTVFKDRSKTGEYKMNMQFAKQSRGAMARFIIQNNLEKEEDLKAFDTGGYSFSTKDSSDREYVYLRG
jgi:cytoplasmic iron level regulating protein YaaA (DUF328/UPF0246 family)